MPAVTPAQLLKALNPLLDKSGGMRDEESSTRIVSLMKDATKLVSKCIYVNICLHTSSEEVLQKFISVGGWGMLSQWLQDAKDGDNTSFLLELLKVYQWLPVSIEYLKQDNTARFIKGLTKHTDEDVKTLSSTVVDSWMKKIKTKSSSDNDSEKSKKKKKDKEREKDNEKDKHKDKDKNRDKDKEREKDRTRDKDREKDRNKDDKEKDKNKDKDDKDRHRHRSSSDKKESSHHKSHHHHHHSSSKSSSNNNDKKTTSSDRQNSSDSREDNSESAESRLGGSTDASAQGSPTSSNPKVGGEEEDEKTRRKHKTVRAFTNKFRSVFDEDDPAPLPPIKKKTPEELKASLSQSKRVSSEMSRDEPAEKIPRLTLRIMTSDPSDPLADPSGTSPLEITHGKIKIIPPKKPPSHEFHESNVFMKELTRTSYQHGPVKRKKKAPTIIPPPTFPVSALKTPASSITTPNPLIPPSTPPSVSTPSPGPVSPLTPPTHKICIPSFYRDTLEEPETPPVSQEERSPPSLEKMDTSEPSTEDLTQDDAALEHSEPPTIHMETDNPEDGDMNTSAMSEEWEDGRGKRGSRDGSPMENAGEDNPEARGSNSKNKKRVRWADDSNLREIFYFELDETERENVNRPKTFSEQQKQDMRSEGRAMETAKRLINDNMVEVLPWRCPQPVDGIVQSVDFGCNSVERGIQQQRESSVLQALFFTKQMLPDSPSEPDVESVEPTDIKIIPLVDETCSGEEYEHTYNVDPANMPYDPAFDISQNPSGGGNGANKGAGHSNIQLPGDINNMLASIQQQSIATGGRSLQANSAVMANVQSILAAIMHGGPHTNTDEIINKLRVALEPLKNQISSSSMQQQPQPQPQPMNNVGEGQQFPPQGQPPVPPQRHGLLGNAPPGFNPMMGPGPRQFGPQGHMMGPPVGGGGMEGEWNNMNMGAGGNIPGPDMGSNMPQGGGGPPMGPRPRGPGFHPMQGSVPGPNMQGNRPVMQGPQGLRMRKNYQMARGPDGRFVCRHFVTPYGCRFGNNCSFLHPGVNGPSLH